MLKKLPSEKLPRRWIQKNNPAWALKLQKRRRGRQSGAETMPAPAALLESLVSHWRLDEASGTRFDAHGSNHLTDNNSVGVGGGVIGNAAVFDEMEEHYLSANSNATLQATGSFTIAGWFYLNSKATEKMGVCKYGDNKEYRLDYDDITDRFRFLVSTDGNDDVQHFANSFGAPAVGTWVFVAGWYDALTETINLQVNGGAVDSAPHVDGIHVDESEFTIGCDTFGGNPRNYWDGLIDSVSIWQRVLTEAERSALYNGGAGLDYPFV
jgi:hypothetical protein